ncbi:MAG: methyltransferase [Desulfobacteraceae bacterium]|nr:methyltransferase [Desulfobacteraceae bacterium]
MEKDKNFDDLALRFQRKVYGGLKGRIRLAVLKKDLKEFFRQALLPAGDQPLNILDAGGGSGPFSIHLAKLGHRITLCDLSEKMLSQAKNRFSDHNLADRLDLFQGPIQEHRSNKHCGYDLVLCHAVLEWVHDPKDLIHHLMRLLKMNGMLSLTFYNLTGMIFKNLLRTNYKKILEKDYAGSPGGLTPTWPRKPEEVLEWIACHPFQILGHSGIRVFHDYILNTKDQDMEPDTVMELELKLSRQLPYRDMGRYQHILGYKKKETAIKIAT